MTVSNRTIQIRLTKDEKEKIKTRMSLDGSHNMSEWIRSRLLSSTIWPDQKIDEIYRFVIEMKREREMIEGDNVVSAS